jgi:hypothetical protein
MTVLQTKKCSRCLLDKPYDAFRRDRRATGQRPSQGGLGLKSRCTACASAQERAYRTKHRERRRLASAAFNATEKGRASQRAHRVSYRDTIKAKAKAHRQAHPERCRAYEKAYQDKHGAAIRARAREKRATQGDAIRAKARANYAEKREHFKNYRAQHKEAINKTKRAWVLRNQGAVAAIRFKRIAAEHQAMPSWANLAAIKAIYEEAARVTQRTGIRHEVDHIIPIQSPLVCGLHVPANLQILTKAANRQKSNRLHGFISAAA